MIARSSRRVRHALAVLPATLALALGAAACGDDDDDAPAAPATAPAATAAPSDTTGTEPTGPGTTVPSTGGIDPMEGADTAPVSVPFEDREFAALADVQIGRHEGFDRVVFEFRGDEVPGYHISYVVPPILQDASGEEVEIEGAHFLEVRMSPASGFDMELEEEVYTGPDRISGESRGTSQIQEVVRTGDFEAVATWVIGLADRVDFRVDELSGPARLVVDVRNH